MPKVQSMRAKVEQLSLCIDEATDVAEDAGRPEGERLAVSIKALVDEVARLRAQHAPLRKTHNGVPVYPGMECWIWIADNEPAPVTVLTISDTSCKVEWTEWRDDAIGDCDYDFLCSTREALEASR